MSANQKVANIEQGKQVEEELLRTISLLQSTIESTADGILAVDRAGKIVSFNKRFALLWQIPKKVLDDRDDEAALSHALSLLKDPDAFMRKVRKLYAEPEADSFDVIEFKDGRTFERYSCPQHYEGAAVGRVWSFRDITGRKHAKMALEQEQERFRLVTQATRDAIYDWDMRTGSIWRNEAYQTTYNTGDLDRSWWIEHVHPADAARIKKSFEAALANQSHFWSDEYRIRKPDGSYATVMDRGYIIYDSDGKPIRKIGAMTDVTERKRTEEALLESQALYHSFVEHLPAGVFRKDYEGRYVFVNSAFCKLKDMKVDEILGKTPVELAAYEAMFKQSKEVRQRTLVEGVNHHELIMRTGKPVELEEVYLQPDGTMEYFHVVKSPVFGADGQLIGSQGIQFDITARRRLEAQLRQSQKMEAFGQLAAGVAHDFNNVLTVILGNLSLLQGGQLSKEEESLALDQSMASAERAASLTRQLLTFGRRQIMQPVDLDLNEVVANATSILQRLIGEHITLETRFAPGGAPVHADLGMMEHTLMNLVINSRDAMPKGGRLLLQTATTTVREDDARLKLKARPGQFIRLSVSDTGSGIAPEHLSHVFEPFFTTKEIGKGTGLGLATVFGIIEQHHGWIEVESEQNKGTAFHMFLPRLTQSTEQTA
jgi:PAS domain S-box-containing protein